MQTGTIARKTDKGFGFIKREGRKKTSFSTPTKCNGAFDSFQEGDTVTFEVAIAKGPNAIKVSKV